MRGVDAAPQGLCPPQSQELGSASVGVGEDSLSLCGVNLYQGLHWLLTAIPAPATAMGGGMPKARLLAPGVAGKYFLAPRFIVERVIATTLSATCKT